MNTLFASYQRLLKNVPVSHVRSLMEQIHWEDRLIAIRGARGVGKTTLMLQYLKLHLNGDPKTTLYVSMDSIYFSRHTLSKMVHQFYLMGGKHLFLDEVHKYPLWSREIKNIYDEYPDLQIVFSGSSLLQILNAETDLSRRCISYDLQGLSFREFLKLRHDISINQRSLEELLQSPHDVCTEVNERCRPIAYFDEYLRTGYYPFYFESPMTYYHRIENVVNLTLDIELPEQCGVDISNVRKLKSLIGILAEEVPFALDMTKLSSMAEMSRTTLLSYLQYLYRAQLVHLLYSDLDSLKKLQKPDKIYLNNTNLLYALSPTTGVNVGTLREVFLCNQLSYQHRLEYSNRQADFTIDGRYTLEVGGKSKEGKQLQGASQGFIAADNIEYAMGNKIPLWAFGLLY